MEKIIYISGKAITIQIQRQWYSINDCSLNKNKFQYTIVITHFHYLLLSNIRKYIIRTIIKIIVILINQIKFYLFFGVIPIYNLEIVQRIKTLKKKIA